MIQDDSVSTQTTLLPRLISLMLLDEGRISRTKKFEVDYFYTDAFLDFASFDEIILVDVTKRSDLQSQREFHLALDKLLNQCFLPVTLGGHIKSPEDASKLFKCGADRVVVASGALNDPALVRRIADTWGSQAVVASVNALSQADGDYGACLSASPQSPVCTLTHALESFEEAGAGEVLINSIDRDGSLRGYDAALATRVATSMRIPFVLAGGAGNWKHLAEGLTRMGASGVATSNIYHQTSQSIVAAKDFLKRQGVPVRLETVMDGHHNA